MKCIRKVYTLSLILTITLIFGILIDEAKNIPVTQLSTPAGVSQDAVFLLDTGERESLTI